MKYFGGDTIYTHFGPRSLRFSVFLFSDTVYICCVLHQMLVSFCCFTVMYVWKIPLCPNSLRFDANIETETEQTVIGKTAINGNMQRFASTENCLPITWYAVPLTGYTGEAGKGRRGGRTMRWRCVVPEGRASHLMC